MKRYLNLYIEMEEDGSATVYMFDEEGGDSTSCVYDDNSCDTGEFDKWLVDNVNDFIMWMQESSMDGEDC